MALRALQLGTELPLPTTRGLCATPGCSLPDFHFGPCTCHAVGRARVSRQRVAYEDRGSSGEESDSEDYVPVHRRSDGEEPPPPKRVPLDVYDGDDLETVAAEFTARHSLPDAYQAQVRQGLRQRAKEQGLVRALFELGVTLLSGEREVLKVYEGDNIDQVAIDFAITHDLGHDEREALVAAVEEQAQARKLVQPLLFKLPVKVGQPEDPWIAQLYVHQGDVPAQIATTFVNRYSGWGNATETAIQITKAILEKAQTVNQAVDEAASRVAGEEAQSKR